MKVSTARFQWVFFLSVWTVSLFSKNVQGQENTGVVKVTSEPEGASVYLEGRLYGEAPVLLELLPGTHSLIVFLDGYPPRLQKVNVVSGRLTFTRVVFENALPKNSIRVHNLGKGGADAGPGTVTITTDPPGLTVVMNDTVVSKTTPVSFDIHSGVFRLKIKQDDVVVVEKTVFVRPGRTVELDYAVKKRRSIDENDPWH